jgi:hypothetical protein
LEKELLLEIIAHQKDVTGDLLLLAMKKPLYPNLINQILFLIEIKDSKNEI